MTSDSKGDKSGHEPLAPTDRTPWSEKLMGPAIAADWFAHAQAGGKIRSNLKSMYPMPVVLDVSTTKPMTRDGLKGCNIWEESDKTRSGVSNSSSFRLVHQ